MVQITKKKYTTNLTMKEINTINALKDNDEYFILFYKAWAALKEGFRKSIKDIWNMYKRYHKNIKSILNFKKIIYKLEEVKLIFIEKVGKVNIYHARKFLEVSKEVTDEKCHESTDITSVKNNDENTQIQKLNKNYINIIYNTSNDLSTEDYKNSLAYKKACIENNKDTLEPNELIMIAKQLLKEKKEKVKNIFYGHK